MRIIERPFLICFVCSCLFHILACVLFGIEKEYVSYIPVSFLPMHFIEEESFILDTEPIALRIVDNKAEISPQHTMAVRLPLSVEAQKNTEAVDDNHMPLTHTDVMVDEEPELSLSNPAKLAVSGESIAMKSPLKDTHIRLLSDKSSEYPAFMYGPREKKTIADKKVQQKYHDSKIEVEGILAGRQILKKDIIKLPGLKNLPKKDYTITVKFLVDPQGCVKFVIVENSSGALLIDDMVVKSMKQWKFSPIQRQKKIPYENQWGRAVLTIRKESFK